jgi:hypothetical protein
MSPHLVPVRFLYLTPVLLPLRSFSTTLASLGPALVLFLFLELRPPVFILCINHQGFANRFLAFARLPPGWDGSALAPQVFAPSDCLTLVLCLQCHCLPPPLGLAFAVLDTHGPLPSQVPSSSLSENLGCFFPQSALSFTFILYLFAI